MDKNGFDMVKYMHLSRPDGWNLPTSAGPEPSLNWALAVRV